MTRLFGISLLIIFSICVLIPVLLHAEESVTVPNGVHYKQASEEVNTQARLMLERYCAGKVTTDEMSTTFAGTKLICAPGLWSVVKEQAETAGIDSEIPTQGTKVVKGDDGKVHSEQATGAAFRSTGRAVKFLTFFAKSNLTNVKKITIRKATPSELRYFWASIPFDIEEPLYVIAADDKRYIVNVTYEDKKVAMLWFDVVGDL